MNYRRLGEVGLFPYWPMFILGVRILKLQHVYPIQLILKLQEYV